MSTPVSGEVCQINSCTDSIQDPLETVFDQCSLSRPVRTSRTAVRTHFARSAPLARPFAPISLGSFACLVLMTTDCPIGHQFDHPVPHTGDCNKQQTKHPDHHQVRCQIVRRTHTWAVHQRETRSLTSEDGLEATKGIAPRPTPMQSPDQVWGFVADQELHQLHSRVGFQLAEPPGGRWSLHLCVFSLLLELAINCFATFNQLCSTFDCLT